MMMHLICLNIIKRVVSDEHKVPMNEYIIFKTSKKLVFVKETCILRVQDNKSAMFYKVM